jgi:uncharacterized protein YggE
MTTIFAFGQTNTSKLDEQPYIEVTGTAVMEVIPDEIYIGIIIREKYINKAKVTIEEQEAKLKTAIKSLGIDMANLNLTDANADYVKIRWQKKDVLTKKDYTLKVSTAASVGQVFLELEKLEITEAYISKVNHSKMDSLKKEIKIKAIKAAKDKADYLLTAIGEQTGKPLLITENENEPAKSYNSGVRYAANVSYIDGIIAKSPNNEEIEFQKIKIQSSIYAKFSIK